MSQPELKKDSRETLYHCTQHLLLALLTEAADSEKQALYKSLEWLGISEIRWLNASADELDSPSADVLLSLDTHQIKGDFSHHAKP
jgi:hypothetical protein